MNMLAVLLLLLVGSAPAAYAQFNPVNPPEPQENIYYNVTVSASNSAAAYIYGEGKYLVGTRVTIRYSSRSSAYKFRYWTLDGELFSTDASFTYTVGESDAEFVAHFYYDPSSPAEPDAMNTNRLYLTSDNEKACAFNIASGTKVESGTSVRLQVYVNQGYDFLGWYDGDTLVSESTSFYYVMPGRDVTLTARFRYNPFNPDEPEGDGTQGDVQTKVEGDVNMDGVVSVSDIQVVVNLILSGAEADDEPDADVNADGSISVSDIQVLVNIILGLR